MVREHDSGADSADFGAESDSIEVREPVIATIEFVAQPDDGDNRTPDPRSGLSDESGFGVGSGRDNGRVTAGSHADSGQAPADIPSSKVKRKGGIDGTAEAIGGFAQLLSVLASRRYGDIWVISNDEGRELGKAAIRCLKHSPIPAERLSLSMDLLGLAGVVGAIIGPRYIAWRQQRNLTPEQAAELLRYMQAQQPSGTTEAEPISPNGLPD